MIWLIQPKTGFQGTHKVLVTISVLSILNCNNSSHLNLPDNQVSHCNTYEIKIKWSQADSNGDGQSAM